MIYLLVKLSLKSLAPTGDLVHNKFIHTRLSTSNMQGVLSKITDQIRAQTPNQPKKIPWELGIIIPFEKDSPKVVSKEDRLSFKLHSSKLATPTPSTTLFKNKVKYIYYND